MLLMLRSLAYLLIIELSTGSKISANGDQVRFAPMNNVIEFRRVLRNPLRIIPKEETH
jgi:hypothetical protein